MSYVRLRLLPSVRCLFDEPVQVKVTGLRPRQEVILRARSTDDKGVVFSSSATYRADGNGEVDLNRDPSLSGSYNGVEPMGLLWSMRADGLHKRFFKDKALEPLMVNFSVHEVEGRMLAEATNERFLIGNGVRRVPVEEGNLRGVLFTPPARASAAGIKGALLLPTVPECETDSWGETGDDCVCGVWWADPPAVLEYWPFCDSQITEAQSAPGEGPFPAVLDMNTLESEKRASLLANKGFVVLAVFVLNTIKDKEIHLDHFEQALQFLQQVPEVGGKGVGIISRSKAADIALSLSAFVPGVEAVVWINGCSFNIGWPLYYKKNLILPPINYDMKKFIPTDSGAVICKDSLYVPPDNRAALIPIEKANCRFLFMASEDDLHFDSKAFMEEMVGRLKHHGKENFETVSYPEAGHLLEPPYGPFCRSSFNFRAYGTVMWGGEPRSHAAAEVHMWKKIQEFLQTHLTCNPAQNKSKL